jgi:hypothetical protein
MDDRLLHVLPPQQPTRRDDHHDHDRGDGFIVTHILLYVS